MRRLLPALPLTFAIAALIVLATFAASCGSTSQAQVRFVNAIADDTQSLDIQFNATKAFNSVPFPGFSGSTYVSVPSGSDKIQGFASGTTTNPVFSQTSPISFNSGKQYTMVATGTLAGTVILLAPADTNTAPANGSVNFRVINASLSGPGSVDVYILPDSAPGTTCFGNPGCAATITALPSPVSSINTTSAYVTMPYNSDGFGYSLYVTIAGQTVPLPGFNGGYSFNVGSVSLGSIRTVVLVDVAGGQGGMSSLPLVLSDLN